MQRFLTTLLFLFAAGTVWAQSTIPGTFSAPAQPTAVVAGPILTPPIVSFGSGLTPPTVINGQSAVVSAPQSTMAEPSMVNAGFVNPGGGYVSMPRPALIPLFAPGGTQGQQQAAMRAPARFDFIIGTGSHSTAREETATGGVGDTSLGEIASSLRKGPAPTQRTFTNDDISRINGMNTNKMPGASTDEPTYPQQQQPSQPHSSIGTAPLPHGAKPSPFAPRPIPTAPTSSTTAASEPD